MYMLGKKCQICFGFEVGGHVLIWGRIQQGIYETNQ